MKLFKCDTTVTLTIVDLPRSAYQVLPPRRWQVIATLAVIVVTAVLWGVL